jgi:hypothetical protein
MNDPEGFNKAMDKLFDEFSLDLATLRVYFREKDAVITADTHVIGGKLFKPSNIICPYGELPSFITDKVSLLRTAGQGVPVSTVGIWKVDSGDDKMFYIKATPKQWNDYCKEKGYE